MHEYFISICIPAYNASKYIAETIQSIFKQTYKNWEIIIVEDGTDDGTKDIVELLAKQVNQKIIYFKNENNIGNSATRNEATKHINGNFIAFIDSDDLWLPDHLQDLVNSAIAHPECDLIHSAVNVFDSDSGEVIFKEDVSPDTLRAFPISTFNRDYTIHPSSIMISRKLYETTGGFTTTLNYAEDLELWIKCARAGFTFAFTGKNTCYYRKHQSGLTKDALKVTLGLARVYDLHKDWKAIPEYIRITEASSMWFSVARLAKKNNRELAIKAIIKSIKYEFSLKKLAYLVFLYL